ncbi:hypothetical protein GOODEAATRI_032719, partial [Goodea atripinnis]
SHNRCSLRPPKSYGTLCPEYLGQVESEINTSQDTSVNDTNSSKPANQMLPLLTP